MTIADDAPLFQIAEPATTPGASRNPGRGIGIDLGTTHSLVAIAPRGAAPRVLADADGNVLTPSVVAYLDDNGPPSVGTTALAATATAPSRVLSSIKRMMGRSVADIRYAHPYDLRDDQGVLRIGLGERTVTPVEVSAEILRNLKLRAEAELGEPVDGAVITVPAYFDDAQRQATRDAGRIAGLKVYRLLAEPTAAALAYGLDRLDHGLFAIYDLGGGTFDISILRRHAGVFQVLATGGDSALGGDDFDRALASLLLEQSPRKYATPHDLALAQDAARRAARGLKEQLSQVDRVVAVVPELELPATEITRAMFEAAIDSLVQRTLRACRSTLRDAGVRAAELDAVVLVGGSTRIPRIRQQVEQAFGRAPLTDLDPDQVVAHGAAIQADILSGSARPGVTLLDVVPLSLGIETMGGIVEKIIPRNATIPIAARQVFTNYSEQQTAMVIHVLQGERELAQDNRSLARFELRGMPKLPPSMARVEVSFQLDADALLTVTARELMTGIKQSVIVQPTHGLPPEEVERLVLESFDHAGDDYTARNIAEARVELGRVILSVRASLAEVGHIESLLPPDDRMRIEAALTASDEAMATPTSDADTLTRSREQLERCSEPFAARRMQRALQAGMAGKRLDEIEAALAAEAKLEARRGGHTAALISDSDET